MAKRSRKPRDLNALAARVVGEATDESKDRRARRLTLGGVAA